MSDYTNTPIGAGYNATSSVNTELAAVETAVNSKVDKSGSVMTGDLDMNSNEILNIAEGTTSTSLVVKSQLDSGLAAKVDKAGDSMTGDLAMGGNKVTGLSDATATGEAVTLDQLNAATFPSTTIDTTTLLISTSPDITQVIKSNGYATAGDGGGAQWKHNGVTGQTASQSPADLGDGLLNDASGNQWEYIPIVGGLKPMISAAAMGVIGSGDKDNEIEAAQKTANSADGGIVLLPSGSIDHSSTINMKVGVTFRGSGRGNQNNPSSDTGTTLNWTGGATIQISFNGAATTQWGGGLESLTIDSNRLATVGLSYKDWQASRFENIEIRQPTIAGLHLTNTAGTPDPTGKAEFRNVNINVRAGTPTTADGILIDGKGTGAEGVTLCNMHNIDINHDNGDGVKFVDRGDNFTWYDLNCFRPDATTGFGVNTSSTNDPGGIACARNLFIRPNLTGGMNIHKEGAARDWEVWNINDLEVGTTVGTAIISGAGKNDVRGYTRGGRMYGTYKVYSPLITMSHENCNGLLYDSANEIIHTADGNFMVDGDVGKTIAFAKTGGAIVMGTGTTANDEVIIAKGTFSGTTLQGGTSTAYEPMLVFGINPTVTMVSGDVLRIGLISDYSTGVGIYLEAAIATNSNYQLVCDDGTRTAEVTGIIANQSDVQWRMSVTSTEVVVWYRVTGTLTWSDPIKVTANIPATSVQLVPAFYLQTTNTTAKKIQVKDLKYGSSTEVLP